MILMALSLTAPAQNGNAVYTQTLGNTSFCEGQFITLNFYMTGTNTNPSWWYQFWVGPCTNPGVFATVSNGGCGAVMNTMLWTSNYSPYTGTITWTIPNTYGSASGTQYNIGASYSANQFVNGTGVTEVPASGQTITIYEAPSTPTITGNTQLCSGNQTTLTSSSLPSYSWSTGATTQSITVSPTATTNYTVSYSNFCGTVSAAVTVTVDSVPPTPVVIPSNDTTICVGNTHTICSDAAAGNQWWRYDINFGTVAVGNNQCKTTSPTLPVGTYTFYTIVTLNGCASDTSNQIVITVDSCLTTGILSNMQTIRPTVFPNPAGETLSVLGNADEIVILDMLGREVYRMKHPRGSPVQINTGKFPRGPYVLLIFSGTDCMRIPVVLSD